MNLLEALSLVFIVMTIITGLFVGPVFFKSGRDG